MSRELEVAELLRGDTALMGILLGGVYTSQEAGVDGIRRGEHSPTKAAFDVDGYLLPCALVKDRPLVPYGNVRDEAEQIVSVSQVVEVYLYQDRGHVAIDEAKERSFSILSNPRNRLTSAYPSNWILEVGPVPDVGPLKGNTTLRQDWQIISLRRG